MPDLAALVTPPLLLDSTGQPANGDIYARLTNNVTIGLGIATPTQVQGVIVRGQFKSLAGAAFNIPVTPEGVGVELYVELVEARPQGVGSVRDRHRIRRFVSVPDQATVTWDELIDTIPVETGGDVVIPSWVATTQAASAAAVAAAAASAAAKDSAEAAEAAAAASAAAVAPGVAGGTATLDGSAKVPDAQIPSRLSDATLATVYSPLLLSSQRAVRNRDLAIDAVAEGADSTGAVTAQPQIGASHNLLPAAGGKVLLRKGSYLLNTRLIITKQGMVLEGEGVDATKLLLDASAFQVGAGDVTIRNLTIKGNGSNARSLFQGVTTGAFKNWRFENVKFEGVGVSFARIGATDNTGATVTTGSGLESFVEFDNCEFTAYTEDGSIHARGVHHVSVQNSWFHNAGTDVNKGDMLKFSAGAEYWHALNNRFTDGTRDAIDCYDAQRGIIHGNTIVNMGAHGIELKVVSAVAPNPADRIRVTSNHVVNAGTGSGAPSMQLSVSNVIATGNLIEGGSFVGMRCGTTTDGLTRSQNIIWTNNHVKGATGIGFFLGGVDGAIIQNNIASGGLSNGFHAATATNSLIVGGASTNLSRNNASADVWA